MEKPKGKAPAGWYDDPDIAGLQYYWNGRSWTSNKRISGDEDVEEALPQMSDNEYYGNEKIKINSNRNKIIIFCILAVLILFFVGNNSPSFEEKGNKYFQIEQSISKVVGKWNVAATPLSEASQRISSGTISASEVRQIYSETNSKFAVIHNELDDACSEIPDFDIAATGKDAVIATAYNALKVTCDLLPQESTEFLVLVAEQISPNGSQEKINYHAQQIDEIISKRKKALVDSLDAMRPYMTEAQKDNAERLLKFLE